MSNYLSLPGVSGSYASTPDSAAISVQELDVMLYVVAETWTPAAIQEIFTKNVASSNNRTYQCYLDTTGKLGFVGSADGISNTMGGVSSVATGFVNGTGHWIRYTYSKTTGDTKFYTSNQDPATTLTAITWTQLGTTVTFGSGNIFDSSVALEIGSQAGGTLNLFKSRVYRAAMYNGYDGAGTLVFDANFVIQPGKLATFAESSSNAAVVTMNGNAKIASDTLPNNYQSVRAGDGMSVSEKIR